MIRKLSSEHAAQIIQNDEGNFIHIVENMGPQMEENFDDALQNLPDQENDLEDLGLEYNLQNTHVQQ